MILTKSNFDLYAAKAYMNPSCMSRREFEDDVSRIRYVGRLLSRYHKTGELKTRLILNHTVVAYNMFGTACTAMMLFKINRKFWPAIIPFMRQLGYLPDVVYDIDPAVVTSTIRDDAIVAASIQEILSAKEKAV